jgi:hypothetical protein
MLTRKALNFIFLSITLALSSARTAFAHSIQRNQLSAASKAQPPRQTRKSDWDGFQLLDWIAFGSGCRSSKKEPSRDVAISFLKTDRFITKMAVRSLELNLDGKEKGLSECAIRLSLQPKNGTRIAGISARAKIHANKDNASHLRANVLLLLGESVLAKRTWDLSQPDFAKKREELINLYSPTTSPSASNEDTCNKPQIIGLDFTFEGLRTLQKAKQEQIKDSVWIRAGQNDDAESVIIEVQFEPCKASEKNSQSF